MASTTSSNPAATQTRPAATSMPLVGQILMMTRRSLYTLLRTPEAILPNLLISAFFLFVYDSALGGITELPGGPLTGIDYLAFTLPIAIISASLNAPAGQAMVRDLENGYFDKLLLTPISRTALLMGHIFASGVVITLQTALILVLALIIGLQPATGISALIIILGFSLMIGMGFGGFTVGIALITNSAAATQGASFIFFPLTFLTVTFVPMELLQGWIKTVATVNPITYILEAQREVLIYGWDTEKLLIGLFACVTLSAIPFFFAVFGLRVRTRRQ
ncbi:MAG: ABC transporter permease [Chloroflexota bacterium]